MRQFALSAGGYDADVVSTGATLRRLRFGGRDLVLPFSAQEARPAMSGALLAPWPGRIGDGRYAFGGRMHQLPLNEVDLGNASHGLVGWSEFEADGSDDGHLALTATIVARPGYPWTVDLRVEFTLGASGLLQEVTATNRSSSPAPFGVGAHPYLLAGPAGPEAVDSWSLELPADRMLNVDARRLPVEEVDVGDGTESGGEFDFRGSRVLGTTVLDRSYTSLRSGPDGWSRVRVTNQRGEGTELAVDDRSRWIHVYSADLSSGSRHRSALAVEPMTCPPDAFRSGRDLVTLEPARSATAAWTISGLHGVGRERPGTPDRTAR